MRVITSLEPDDTGTVGRKVMVMVTPVSDTTYLDKVICNKNASDNNQYDASSTYLRPIRT